MRQIDEGLHRLFDALQAHFIEQDGKAHRHQNVQRDLPQGNGHSIFQRIPKARHGKKHGKVFQPDPLGAEDALGRQIFHERNAHAGHGDVIEHEQKQHRQRQQDIKRIVHFQPAPGKDAVGFCMGFFFDRYGRHQGSLLGLGMARTPRVA